MTAGCGGKVSFPVTATPLCLTVANLPRIVKIFSISRTLHFWSQFLLTEAVSLHLRHHISDSAKSGVKAAALSVHLAEKIRILYPDIVKARSKLLDKIGEEAAMRLKMATSDEWRPKDNIARPVAAAAAGEKQAEPQLVHHGGDGGRGPGRRRRLLR